MISESSGMRLTYMQILLVSIAPLSSNRLKGHLRALYGLFIYPGTPANPQITTFSKAVQLRSRNLSRDAGQK
uniref:Uncharacterized protein n=1 Tax=Picea sitchensis TaxID=3332 RepID=A0A6B9XXQ6_PICSI|nr:hypothetical protein Q903MT_gene6782 [Picea sitchensis]